jgi:hypothetical protein
VRGRRGPGSVASSGSTTEEGFEVAEQERGRMAAERASAHLARAKSELEAVQRFVDPGGDGETALALARSIASAKPRIGFRDILSADSTESLALARL